MAGVHNLEVDVGANFAESYQWQDESGRGINVANYAATLTVRPDYSSTAALITLTNASGITLGATAENLGRVDVTMTAAQTAQANVVGAGRVVTINCRPARAFVYDLVMNNAGARTRLLQGEVYFFNNVT